MMIEKCSVAITPDILDFITHNNVASVCCCADNSPHCFNCFYAVLDDDGCIVFKSSADTMHMKILAENSLVAGTIVASDISMTKVVGAQFEGINIDGDKMGLKAAKAYYSRYPFAIAMPGKLWILELHSLKYTSTINGIKRKLEWRRD